MSLPFLFFFVFCLSFVRAAHPHSSFDSLTLFLFLQGCTWHYTMDRRALLSRKDTSLCKQQSPINPVHSSDFLERLPVSLGVVNWVYHYFWKEAIKKPTRSRDIRQKSISWFLENSTFDDIYRHFWWHTQTLLMTYTDISCGLNRAGLFGAIVLRQCPFQSEGWGGND